MLQGYNAPAKVEGASDGSWGYYESNEVGHART